MLKPLKAAFSEHPRRWREFRYVYPVIARRSRGLSIGVNLNPDGACNFDCIYCSVDRTAGGPLGKGTGSEPNRSADEQHALPRGACPLSQRTTSSPLVRAVDPAILEAELRHIVENRVQLFDEPEFRQIPAEFRRLNDIAFSGDGEATAVPVFGPAVRIAAAVRRDFQLDDVKIVVITNAGYLTRPAVVETLAFLDQNNGEIWAKLDAGTEEYYRRVNRPNFPLQHVLDNILATARVRPIVVQSLFMRIAGDPPPAAEIAAYVSRLRWLLDNGARLSLVQVYTVARRTAESYVTPLTGEELEQIAAAVRPLGVPVAVFP